MGGPHLNEPPRRIPHFRDGFILDKVGHFRGSENPDTLTSPMQQWHPRRIAIRAEPLEVRVVAVEDQLSFFLTGLPAEEERSMESPRTVSHTQLR